MDKMNNKGITMIALIVTIIVLIVIASISMATMNGDFSLFGKTENAINNYEKAEKNELDAVNDILNRIPKYLVDKVEIGDYVNIGISYTNQMAFTAGYTESSTELTGWRVLSKNGSGASGTVTLVSAGVPLKFYHNYTLMNAQTAIDTYFNNLNTKITIVGSGAEGFTANGFSSNNLASIWASNNNINGATAHAMTTDELMTAYNSLTNQTKTISNIYYGNSSEYFLRTSVMLTYNSGMSTKAYDLLGNGLSYWLGGTSHATDYLWLGRIDGAVNLNYEYTLGVRPVISLKSGTEIADTAGEDGASVSTAYTIAK